MEIKKGDYVRAKVPRLEEPEIGRVLGLRGEELHVAFVLADGLREDYCVRAESAELVTFRPAVSAAAPAVKKK